MKEGLPNSNIETSNPDVPVLNIGEWEKLFYDYKSEPYVGRQSDVSEKKFNFIVNGIGPFIADLNWMGFIDRSQQRGLLLTSHQTTVISTHQAYKLESEVECSLMMLSVEGPEHQEDKSNIEYVVEVGIDDEVIATNEFDYADSEPYALDWTWKSKLSPRSKGLYVFVPEEDEILNQIQLRIVPRIEKNKPPISA